MKNRVGMYDLGGRMVNLYVSTELNGGWFSCKPPSGLAEIVIGIEEKTWGDVCEILTHEAMELACTDVGLRYKPAPDYGNENGGYFFSMNHTQFSEACARAGYFIAHAINPLAEAFNAHVEKEESRRARKTKAKKK